MEVLKPYRVRINVIDEQIIELLSRRYAIIEQVGHFKAKNDIASVLPDRVDEVRENAARRAGEKGMDADFIRKIYAQIIDHSCALEETIIQKTKKQKAG